MRINSSSLVIFALSLKSSDGASLKLNRNRAPLQKQLSQALKIIKVHQSTAPTAQKSVIRGLNQEDIDSNPIISCIKAFLSGDGDGDDDGGGSPSSSESGFYCSNNGEDYAQDMGGILCPSTDPEVPVMCPDGTDATPCCDADGSCTDGDDDWCCNIDGGTSPLSGNGFYCSNNGEDYAQDMGGILCPSTDPEVPVVCPDGTEATPCCDADGSCTDGDDDWCCGDWEDDINDDVSNPLSFLDDIGSDSEICDISTGICDFADSPELVNAMAACEASEQKFVLNDVLICKEDSDPEDEDAPDMDIIIRNAPICVPQVCPDNVKMTELLLVLVQLFPDVIEELEELPTLKEQCDSGISIKGDSGSDNDDGSANDDSDNDDNGSDTSSVAARSMIWSFLFAATVSIGAYSTI